jgi:hypothetical protein
MEQVGGRAAATPTRKASPDAVLRPLPEVVWGNFGDRCLKQQFAQAVFGEAPGESLLWQLDLPDPGGLARVSIAKGRP